MKVGILALGLAVALTTLVLQPAPVTGQTKLVMAFVPSQQTDVVLSSGQILARMLSVALGIPVEAVVATSYSATIEAMCSGRADIGALNPFGYVLAHEKCGVEVSAISVRFGLPYYRGQFNARADANINKIEDLRGKRFAFVDAASTSGYLFPAAQLKKMGFDPDKFFSQTVFAGSHPNVILAIYRGQVDGGATFEDARTNIQAQFPDVMQKVKVIGYTNPVPNDTWSVSPRLSADMRAKIKDRLLRIAKTAEGQAALRSLYSIEGLTDVVTLTNQQARELGISFPPEIRERIVQQGGRVTIPIGDWYFQPIRDAAKFLGLDLQRLAR
ncbi:MAG TPA: phosphate/phosphite/phosphonate ABC transporter substrate-binding protein [bacterium]|jgi:phosphonate transport system substrate-binding protein|nr:phosphate/phosphite/phosphonate ABC transporter substrate-binding protein [bacterium]